MAGKEIKSGISADRLVSLEKDTLANLLAEHARQDPELYAHLLQLLDQVKLAKTSDSGPAAGSEEQSHFVGNSPAMLEVFSLIRRFAVADAPVLIRGETGTGKELAALALHERSPRAKKAFVAINCAALPPTLIGSELFGHEKGSFTGATQRKTGRIESAEGGTLFLDEIGDLPLETQGHFLRFLQEGTIDRIGGKRSLSVDVRVIAATHINLEQAVQENRFRDDLYYRLNGLTLQIPPLRDRGADVPLLATYFLRRCSHEMHSAVRGLNDSALAAIEKYHWPGNVRELISCVRRAVLMAEGTWITESDLDLPELMSPKSYAVDSGKEKVIPRYRRNGSPDEERQRVLRALENAGYNISQAARDLRISRVTLYSRMKEFKIDSSARGSEED